MPSKTWSELLDDAEQEGGGFSVLPAAEYDFVISRSEAKKTGKGKDMFFVLAKVIDGPSKGRTVPYNFVVSPESPVALRIFFSQMKVLGLTRESFFSTNPTPEQIANALYGKVFRGSLVITPDNKGEDRNEIKNFASVTDNVRLAGEALVAGGDAKPAPSMAATPTGSIPATPPSPSVPAPTPTPTPESVPTPEVPTPAPAEAAPQPPVAAPAPPAASGGSIPPPPPAPQF